MERDGTNAVTVCDDLIGLHATSNTTPYLSLFNRINGFQVGDLERELYSTKGLVRVRAMRGTFFLVSSRRLPLIMKVTQVPQQTILRSLSRWRVSYRDFASLSRQILHILSRGAKTAPEIKREISPAILNKLVLRQGRRILSRSNLHEVLNLLVLQRRVWSLSEPLQWEKVNWDGYGSTFFESMTRVVYSTAPEEEPSTMTTDDAKAKLAELYIKQYGPVTVEDVAWWIGGSPKNMQRILEGLFEGLVQVRIRGFPEQFLMDSRDLQGLEEQEQEVSVVRFLPYEDPYVKGFKLKERLIPDKLVPLAYTMGNALPTVLVDGRIVATWNVTVRGPELRLNVGQLVPLKSSLKSMIRNEGQMLGKFLMKESQVNVSVRVGRTSKWQAISLSARPNGKSANTCRPRARNGPS